MSEALFSISEVAGRLRVHPRTIRNYVRDGRLKAVRIGRQFRVAQSDLEALVGGALPADTPVRRSRNVEVASVLSVDAIRPESAMRLADALLAAAKSHPQNEPPLRIDTHYDEERARLKVIVAGGVETTSALLGLAGAWLASGR